MEFPGRSNLPEERRFYLRGLGANGADLTVEAGSGSGATLVRTGEGAYKVVLPFNPGVFKGWQPGFGAATMGDLKGYTAVRDTPTAWDGSTWELPFTVYNSSFTAADLIADQYIDLVMTFGMRE
jgi:hypothetical protein